MAMKIRNAEIRDARGIHDLFFTVMDFDYPISETERMISLISGDENNFVFVAADDDHVAGCMEITVKYSAHKEPSIEINSLAVLPEEQGKGIGTSLIRHVEEFAKEKGIGYITVGSRNQRIRAHEFYVKNGFSLLKEHKVFHKKFPVS